MPIHDRELKRAALVGLHHERLRIDAMIERLEREVGEDVPGTEGPRLKRRMSAAGRRRIAAATKARWAAYRKAKKAARRQARAAGKPKAARAKAKAQRKQQELEES